MVLVKAISRQLSAMEAGRHRSAAAGWSPCAVRRSGSLPGFLFWLTADSRVPFGWLTASSQLIHVRFQEPRQLVEVAVGRDITNHRDEGLGIHERAEGDIA